MGGWLEQAVDADIVEIENASYFNTSSETTVGKVVEGEDIWLGKSFRQSIQDGSTHASFIHSRILSPTFCSSDTRALLSQGSGNGGVSTKTTSREEFSKVHRTYANSVVQGDNVCLTSRFPSVATFINLSPM